MLGSKEHFRLDLIHLMITIYKMGSYIRQILLFGVIVALQGTSDAQVKTQAQIILEDLQTRQNRLFEAYAREENPVDRTSMETQLYGIKDEYQALLSKNQSNVAVLVTFGLFLAQIDQREDSLKLLLKADSLDPTQPQVKNQLGNFMTEEANFALALPYFLDAIKLQPKEPLYHYQLGNLLFYFRDAIIRAKVFTEAHLNEQMFDAFKNAARLGSDNLAYRYRFAEAYYDIPDADMEEALKEWEDIENSTYSEADKQIVRLHQANVHLIIGNREMVPYILDKVTDPKYDDNKQKILEKLREED